jgi:transposase
MHLRKHDLLQMDAEWLKKLPAARLLEVSIRLLDDVKELQDRLNQNPANSSRPPTSQVPWEKPGTGEEEDEGMPAKRPPAKVPEAATEAMDTADSTEETVPAGRTAALTAEGFGAKARQAAPAVRVMAAPSSSR